jgi:hypothetical protein
MTAKRIIFHLDKKVVSQRAVANVGAIQTTVFVLIALYCELRSCLTVGGRVLFADSGQSIAPWICNVRETCIVYAGAQGNAAISYAKVLCNTVCVLGNLARRRSRRLRGSYQISELDMSTVTTMLLEFVSSGTLERRNERRSEKRVAISVARKVRTIVAKQNRIGQREQRCKIMKSGPRLVGSREHKRQTHRNARYVQKS